MQISRNIEYWRWYKDTNTFRVFFHLLLKAQYQQGEFLGETLNRGQIATGRKQLATELGLTEQKVRTALDHLTKSGEIAIKSTNKFSVITICKYDSWQGCENETNQQSTNNQPTTNYIQLNNNIYNDNIEDKQEEIKLELEEKEKKKKIKKEKDEKFEVCWLAYRRKGNKGKSFEQWQKLSEEERDMVLPHVKVYASSRETVYQKDFERYLRDKIFTTIIVQGNNTIYDPEQFTNKEEYRPSADGVFQTWDNNRKCLWFNGFIDQLNDGYTAETRPNGAKVAWNMYEWVWNSQTKEWIKQND
ncbi:MAG: hypothetical protein IJ640_06125 [Prevotella sp.]|nr:hypothetical protein [Prevotella sp.]